MYNIKDWLKKENIHLHLHAESELEAIWTMLDLATKNPVVLNTRQLAQSVYENEVLGASHRGSSGITFYALTDAVVNPLMVVGHFKNGIGYYSRKNKPIDLVVLLAAPERFENQLRNMVSSVKDMLCDCEFIERIRSTDNPTKVYQHFLEHCLEISLNQIQGSYKNTSK